MPDRVVSINELELWTISYEHTGVDLACFKWENTRDGMEWKQTEGLTVPWKVAQFIVARVRADATH